MPGDGTSAIERAGETDAEPLLDAYEWLFSPPGSVPPGWDRGRAAEALRGAIAGERSEIFLARDADTGAIAGFCSAYLDLDSVRFGSRCWVEDLAVDPRRRSRGLGKALLDAAKEWGRERGATHLELDSGIARGDAHRFYERESPSWTGYQYSWLLSEEGESG